MTTSRNWVTEIPVVASFSVYKSVGTGNAQESLDSYGPERQILLHLTKSDFRDTKIAKWGFFHEISTRGPILANGVVFYSGGGPL